VRLSDFDYDLPPEAIAQEPLPERDASRLLVLDRRTGAIEHRVFRDLPSLLDPKDLLVVNRSRVLPARLRGRRDGGGVAEVLLVRRRAGARWDALLRPGRRLRTGSRIEVSEDLTVVVEPGGAADGTRQVRLEARGDDSDAALERHGHIPLPPYIRRDDRAEDRERYQTVYARESGSVAAPTAGLHFTSRVFADLDARGVARAEVILHVGPGTFRPVQVDDVTTHTVDPEPFVLPPETATAIDRARERGGRVVAAGTTTTRVLESRTDGSGRVAAGEGETSLVIVPGHRFRAVDALLTNFHLPRSSLLLLVAAIAGRERVLAAYAEAIARGYRFYSYGDAMLVI